MELGGRSQEIDGLRRAIVRIEGEGQAPASFAGRCASPRVSFGRDTALDRALNGLARGALHEVVAASPGDAPAASGFALALAARFASALDRAAPVVWIVEDHAKAETGALYAPGLASHGLDPSRLVVVEAASGPDSLWAMEEALKCRAVAAVVGEVWRLKSYDLAASRRLVLAAGRSGTPALMVPAGAAGRAESLSSAARTRFELRAAPGAREPSAGDRTPLPGLAAWEVRVARIRAGPGSAPDLHRFWPILWDHEEALFRDALPFPLPTPAADRPDQAGASPAGGRLVPLARRA